MCLKWLQMAPPGQTMIDYGCGSGILSVAACLFGAKRVVCPSSDVGECHRPKVAKCHRGLAELQQGVEVGVHSMTKSQITSKDDTSAVHGKVTFVIGYVMIQ